MKPAATAVPVPPVREALFEMAGRSCSGLTVAELAGAVAKPAPAGDMDGAGRRRGGRP